MRTFVWLYVGPGVGSAIVQDGALVTGTRGFAGEIGHCRVADDGPQLPLRQARLPRGVHVGRRHRRRRRVRRACRRGGADATARRRRARRAREGHDGARRVLDDAGHMLGLGTSYLVSILNPELVVVGGEVGRSVRLPARSAPRCARAGRARSRAGAGRRQRRSRATPAVAGAVLLAFEAGVAASEVDA